MANNIETDIADLPARERIIMTAFELFHSKGLNATSVDDILKASNTGKSQFYHYFKSKEGLIVSLLQKAREMISSGQTHMQPIKSWDDFRAWLDAIIEKYSEQGCNQACPIGQICGELSEKDEAIADEIRLLFDCMKKFPHDFFLMLEDNGELSDGVDVDHLAGFCISCIQGAGVLSKAEKSKCVLVYSLDYLYDFVRSKFK